MEYKKAEPIALRTHPQFNEKWVQERIADDPRILGLGDVVLRQKERPQPRAGRLDLLLQDAEEARRYEVELQLGQSDESHIVRTIEYWDIERRRYPQYDHVAVLIAEDITSRFLNVIGLFNGTIPIIALQLRAFAIDDKMTLVFTKVLDEFSRGPVDEDEDAAAAPTDRSYWEAKSNTVALVDRLMPFISTLDPGLKLKYNKFYIGLAKDDRPNNFVDFRPQKRSLMLEFRLSRSADVEAMINDANLESLDYSRWGYYRVRLTADDIQKHKEVLEALMRRAFEENGS